MRGMVSELGDAFDLRSRRRAVGGIALILTVQYLIAEAVTASAWTRVPYSYAANYISDLGVQACYELPERSVCSPWHLVMNTGFVVQGVLAIIALLCLAGLIAGRRRWVPVTIGVVHAVGLVMVGLSPGSVAENLSNDTTRTVIHSVGALMAIAGGNLLVIAVGATLLDRARVFGIVSMGFGALGFIPLALNGPLLTVFGVGGVERLMVYPFIVWMIGTGVAIMIVRGRQLRAAPPRPASAR